MRAYLIDPAAKTVTEIDYSGDYRDIYTLGGFDCFDAARFNAAGDAVFVDDEGLIKSGPKALFMIEGYVSPLVGRGIVLGVDSHGASVSPTVPTLEAMRALVTFMDYMGAGLFLTDRGAMIRVD